LIAAVDQISWRKNLGLSQNFVNVDHQHSPAVVFQFKWNLGHKAVLSVKLSKQIADRNSNSM
jgi:hypothetical protein